MKPPRVSLATVGFVILVAAVDFAVIRWAFQSESDPGLFAMLFLPMIDVLLAVAYRAWNRGSRPTASRISFLIAGSLATAAFFAFSIAFPDAVIGGFRIITRPFFRPTLNALTRMVGNRAMYTGVMQMTLMIVFEFILPIIYFTAPPLIVALIGGRIGRRWDTRRTEGNSLPIGPSLQTS